MPEIRLSSGTIGYRDSGGNGPVLLLLHGLMMDGSLWDDVVADLAADHRCVVPTLPLGAHRRGMDAGADLSLRGVAGLVEELLERLDLRDVILVGNDTGGVLVQLLAGRGSARIGRIVLASCDAFENYPPSLTGRALALSGRLSPRLFGLFMQQMRLRPLRRLPLAFGWLTRRGDAATARWIRPVLAQQEIRRDAVQVLRAMRGDRPVVRAAPEALAGFERPALVVWASEDRVMPLEHGRRLAAILPQAELVEIADSYTLIALDQPAAFARHLRRFAHATELAASPSGAEDR